MFCPACGTSNPDDARTCSSCGKEMPGSETQYAGWGARLLAIIIDGILLSIVTQIILVTILDTSPLFGNVIAWAYAIYFLGGQGGQTLGKKAMGIKVVKADGSPIDYGTAALREIVGKSVSAIILGIGFLFPLWDARKQALHDKIAQSLVVKA